MNFRFVDLPRPVPTSTYEDSIQTLLTRLRKSPAVKTVFQIGGVSSPGISDIDLFVVFRDGSSFEGNPVRELSGDPAYLFTHNLFGTEESLAVQMEPHTFFGSYRKLYGDDIDMQGQSLSSEDQKTVEKQVALEYLAKAFLSISVSSGTGIIKARSTLLHAKALLLDLRLLGIASGPDFDAIQKIVELRSNWFHESSPQNQLSRLIDPYRKSLSTILKEAISQHGFYVSQGTDMQVAKNMQLVHGKMVQVTRTGPGFPAWVNATFPMALKLHKRFGKHLLSLPLTTVNIPPVLTERTRLFRDATTLNLQRFPAFLPTAYGLHLFKTKAS